MAAGVYKGLTIELDAKTTRLDAALRKVENEAKSIQREMREMQRSLDLDPSGPEAYARQVKLLDNGIKNAVDKANKLKAALADPKNAGKITADQFTKMQAEIAECEGRVKRYNDEIAKLAIEHAAADSAIGRTGRELTELGAKLEPIGMKMQSAGRAMTMGLTLPIVGAATASVKAATDIDTALTGVRKTVDGTEEDYQRLKDAAIEFSKNNGVSAAEVLDIQSLGAQLGFTIDELDEFSSVVAGLDISTNLDAETAATELAQFANIMGMSHDEVSNFASTLIELGNNMATTESDIMNMSMRIAGAGKSIGLTESDVLGLSAALSSVGIEAEAGGTAISTIMSNIDKEVALGTENMAKWASVANMSADEFSKAWNADALGTFQEVLHGMSESDENLSVLLDELGISSIRQTDVMKRLVNASELLPKALDYANNAYEENTALAREVANFNESLAVKFEMVRNRVTAVASEIGEVLADALLETIDAAEPLFQAIEDGARAFTEMSEGEQRAIIQTVAIIAALGPALTMFGKVAQSVSVLGSAMTSASKVFATFAVAAGKNVPLLDAEGKAISQMGAQAKIANVGMTALKATAAGLIAALAIAAVVEIAQAIGEVTEKAERYRKATEGLREANDRLRESTSVLSGGFDAQETMFDNATRGIREYLDATEKLAESGGELASSINAGLDEALGDGYMAEYYARSIMELAGNCEGSAEKLIILQDAVNAYNELTGSSIEMVDGFSGALDINSEKLAANADAYGAAVMAKAYAEATADAAKHVAELTVEQDKQTAKLEEVNAQMRELEDMYGSSLYAQAGDQYNKLKMEQQGLEESLKSLDGQLVAANETLQYSTEAQARAQQAVTDTKKAMEEAAESAEDYQKALGEADGSEFAALAESLGKDVDSLAESLDKAGISSEELARIGVDSFAKFYDGADSNLEKVHRALAALDYFELSPKDFEVTDEGTIALEDGRIIDLDKRTIDGKTFEVDDNGTITVEGEEVEGLKAKIQEVPDSKTTDFYANDFISDTVSRIKSKISELSGATVSLSTGENAAGGLTGVRIPRHAAGGLDGVVTRATLTSVGLVGEAGNEYVHPFGGGSAIVPIQNSRYVRPLAQSIASEMRGISNTKSTVINLNLAYDASDDAAALARGVARKLGAIMDMRG